MAKIKLTVTTEVGTFTRTTARTYEYIVVSKGLKESYLRARGEESLAYNRKLETRYQAVVDGKTTQYDGRPIAAWQMPEFPGYLAGVQDEIRTHAERLAKDIADNQAHAFFVQGWAGRLDLARKVADKLSIYMDVRIYSLAGERVR